MHGFVSRLEEINALAESSPGFVWRFTDAYQPSDDRVVFNLSVWESVEALKQFTYRSAHRELFSNRENWFERMPTPSLAMWWILGGERPTVENAIERLDHIRDHGDTAFAFTFRNLFPAPPLFDRAQTA